MPGQLRYTLGGPRGSLRFNTRCSPHLSPNLMTRLVLVGRCLPDHGHRHEEHGNQMLSRAGEEPEMLSQRIVDPKCWRSDSPNLAWLGTLPLPMPSRTGHPGEATHHRVLPDQIYFVSKHRYSRFRIKARIYVWGSWETTLKNMHWPCYHGA